MATKKKKAAKKSKPSPAKGKKKPLAKKAKKPAAHKKPVKKKPVKKSVAKKKTTPAKPKKSKTAAKAETKPSAKPLIISPTDEFSTLIIEETETTIEREPMPSELDDQELHSFDNLKSLDEDDSYSPPPADDE